MKKKKKDSNNPELKQFLQLANNIAREFGYTKIEFFNPRTGSDSDGFLVQLLAQPSNVILSSCKNKTLLGGKIECLKKFLNINEKK
jgi:hypothetical protein